MLNDVMSLAIALYAMRVRLSPCIFLRFMALIDSRSYHQLSQRSVSAKYTYGWHRAEILAALINAVFLCALCFSFFMEAIERFTHPPGVWTPENFAHVTDLPLQKLRIPSLWLSSAPLAWPAILVAFSSSTVRIDSGAHRERMR